MYGLKESEFGLHERTKFELMVREFYTPAPATS